MIQGVEGWVEKLALAVEGGVKNVGMLESSRASEPSKAWYVGAVQRVPTEIHNKFQSLTRDDEDEEEKRFEECVKIPSLESSEDEEASSQEIPSKQDLEEMIK
eukprot:3057625-Karenia_brevis.AAC.1